jgi:hypothetical protein
MNGAWKATRGKRVHPSGARAERVETTRGDSYWRAFMPDGEPVRCDKLADGSDYTPRAWHGPADKPVVRRFPSAKLAMQVVERGLA